MEEINVDRPCQNGSRFCPVRLILVFREEAPAPCHLGALSSLRQHAHCKTLSRESTWCSLFGFSFECFISFYPQTESDPALLFHPFLEALLFLPKVINQSGLSLAGVTFCFHSPTMLVLCAPEAPQAHSSACDLAAVCLLSPLMDQQCLEHSGQQNKCLLNE